MAANTTIDYIIGMPPSNSTDETVGGRTNIVMENSMPIAKIYPGTPSFTKGLTLFSRTPAFRSGGEGGKKSLSYSSLLDSHGYNLKQPKYTSNGGTEGCIVLAYQADSFPTDSFSNEYGENFLQGMTNVASEGAASIMQMMGSRNLGSGMDKIAKSLGEGGKASQFAGKAIGTGSNLTGDLLRSILPNKGVDLVSKLSAGSRIDFPMLWKSSSFQPSYTMTVRLYNPYPGNNEATKKYIAAPIAAIMLLAIPVSQDGITYSWPFIHKIVSPGIYNLDPAFISNVTIIKGGDQQQISYKQKLGIVDIRIDFGSLFNSMLAAHGLTRTRPTLDGYLKGMVGDDAEKQGVKNFSTTPGQERTIDQKRPTTNLTTEEQKRPPITKNQAYTQTELTDEDKDSPPDRILETTKLIQTDLELDMPEGFRR